LSGPRLVEESPPIRGDSIYSSKTQVFGGADDQNSETLNPLWGNDLGKSKGSVYHVRRKTNFHNQEFFVEEGLGLPRGERGASQVWTNTKVQGRLGVKKKSMSLMPTARIRSHMVI